MQKAKKRRPKLLRVCEQIFNPGISSCTINFNLWLIIIDTNKVVEILSLKNYMHYIHYCWPWLLFLTQPMRSSSKMKNEFRAIRGHLMYFLKVYMNKMSWFFELSRCIPVEVFMAAVGSIFGCYCEATPPAAKFIDSICSPTIKIVITLIHLLFLRNLSLSTAKAFMSRIIDSRMQNREKAINS